MRWRAVSSVSECWEDCELVIREGDRAGSFEEPRGEGKGHVGGLLDV